VLDETEVVTYKCCDGWQQSLNGTGCMQRESSRDYSCDSTTIYDYDTTTIRRYHDALDYDGSDRNYDLRSIRLRYDCDETTTKN